MSAFGNGWLRPGGNLCSDVFLALSNSPFIYYGDNTSKYASKGG